MANATFFREFFLQDHEKNSFFDQTMGTAD